MKELPIFDCRLPIGRLGERVISMARRRFFVFSIGNRQWAIDDEEYQS